MEVIFIKDLKNQGKKGQIKNVKDGYAKNYLIKNGYAVIKNQQNLMNLKHEEKKKEEQDELNRNKAKEQKEILEKITLEFKVKTGTNDKVFGSISAKQIKDRLQEQNINIDKKMIDINNPISSLGYHNINIVLYQDVIATIKIHVVK